MTQNIAQLDGLVPERLAPKTRKIVLEGYDLAVDIGFHDFEVGTPQRLLVTVEVWVDERAFAPNIRVCGIAPSVTMVSGPQSRANFDRVHGLNALGRGVEVSEIVAALRFIIATPSLTGHTILLDGGQRFLSLPRDVQFLEPR